MKQHLFTSSLSRSDGFDSSRLDSHLGVLCMTYLDFTDLKGRLSKVMNGSNTPIKPMQLGISQLGSPGGSTGRMALKLLSNRHQFRDISPREIERKAQELLRHEDSDPQTRIMEQDFHFLEYARYNWVTHITDIDPDEVNPTWRLFCRCVEEDDIVLCKPWESMQGTDETRPDMPGTIKWLLAHGNPSLLMYYIKRQPHILTDQAKHEIFQAFILQGNIRLVEWILQHGDISTDPIPHGIFLASRNGLGDIQEILLRGVVDVDSRVHDQTALQAAAAEGHLKIVERLLVAKADVNARAGYPSRHTALQLAAANGHLEVVERLLIAKADVNALPEPAYLHLGQISTRGFGETVDRLLATKTNIYSLAKFGYTRLQVATIQGYLESAERLLATKDTLSRSGHTALRETIMQCHRYFLERIIAANADVNTPRYPAKLFQPTPLQAAAAEGHLEIVETLLATTNDNMTLRGGHSVTKLASVNSYLEMVERLLAKGAHIEAPLQGFSGTALQVAVNNGHLKIVERLIAANADVNAASRGYLGTALQAAASKGHLEIVERLLAANADVNAPGHPTKMFQQTALQAAAEEGHLEIVKRLLAAGANVNAPPQGINGETALRSALKTRDHVDLVKCLEQHMEARIDD